MKLKDLVENELLGSRITMCYDSIWTRGIPTGILNDIFVRIEINPKAIYNITPNTTLHSYKIHVINSQKQDRIVYMEGYHNMDDMCVFSDNRIKYKEIIIYI